LENIIRHLFGKKKTNYQKLEISLNNIKNGILQQQKTGKPHIYCLPVFYNKSYMQRYGSN